MYTPAGQTRRHRLRLEEDTKDWNHVRRHVCKATDIKINIKIKLQSFDQLFTMRLVCVFAALLACSAATAAFDSIHDVCLQRPSSHANKVSLLMELCPAELETIPANAYGSRSKPSVLAAHPWPWSNTFYQSIPANLTAFNLSTAQTPPVFAVLGDAMGALGFQMCDIEHYLDHENHTLAPCQDRAGWASKVAGAYDDKLWLFHHMIRSTDNAKRVVVSEAGQARLGASLYMLVVADAAARGSAVHWVV